jgi:hypothetical protein
MISEQRASLAQSLLDNDAFQEAMTIMRDEALDRLAGIPYEARDEFYTNQAIVKVVDGIHENLEQMIRSGTPPKPPGIA